MAWPPRRDTIPGVGLRLTAGVARPRVRRWLAPLTPLYGEAVAVRNRAYDRGWLTIHRASGPVISVGNIAVGGQGKTPMVLWLSARLEASGWRVGVVSRGYGRTGRRPIVVSSGDGPLVSSDVGGDEAVLTARRTRAVVLVDRDRARAADRAFREFDVDVVVLDDGFQHRRLHRDLDILVERTPPGHLLPRGLSREPASSQQRADVLVRIAYRPATALSQGRLDRDDEDGSVSAVWRPRCTVALDGSDPRLLEELRGRRVVTFSGIANPYAFENLLGDLGADVVASLRLADHAGPSPRQLDALVRAGIERGADLVLTTEKDAARFREVRSGIRALRGDLEFDEDVWLETRMNRMLVGRVSRRPCAL